MKRDDVTTIIHRVYGRRYGLGRHPRVVSTPRYYLTKIQPVFLLVKEKRFKIMALLLLASLTAGSIYCFNLLVQTEQDVLASRGKVAALMQRRNDLSINLSKAVLDYSKHEQTVFKAVVALRSLFSERGIGEADLEKIMSKLDQKTGAGADAVSKTLSGAGMLPSLDRLLAIAEQYPDLKLSSNFNNLMTALVDVEKDLATERILYNDVTNIYSTTVAKFPINAYARIFGFAVLPYFEATHDAKSFRPIDY